MRKLILFVVLGVLATPALADDVRVRGYNRADGTYVAPHTRTAPNSTTTDNWSTRPNVNPYTGKEGTRSPSYEPKPYTPPCYYNCKK